MFTGVWSGGAMVLGKLPVPGRPTIWIIVGQGLTALAVGAGGGCLDIFNLVYLYSSLSPSLWETARYRLKYCLKGLLSPKQPTKIHVYEMTIRFPVQKPSIFWMYFFSASIQYKTMIRQVRLYFRNSF